MVIEGKFLLEDRIVEAGMLIEDGVVKSIKKELRGKKIKGLIMPAGIDVHVHLRDFEESHKETIDSGTLAALNGGICLVVDQPNTKPVVDSYERFVERIKKAEKYTWVDYSLNLALTKENAKSVRRDYEKLRSEGYNPRIGEVFLQHEELQVSYEDVYEFRDLPINIHAEDPDFVEGNSIPNFRFRKREAEIVAVKKCLEAGKFYFCHVSTKEAFELIKSAGAIAEVTPHHLLLSEDDYEKLGKFVNVNPPLRRDSDRRHLLENFGSIDVLASDHAPHTREEKEAGASGYPGVETLYPLMMGLVFKGVINVFELAEKLAKNPAKIYGFKRYGEIKVGSFANLVAFDLSELQKVTGSSLHSKCGWTPFEGFPAIFPHTVMLRGEFVKERGEIIDGRIGKVYNDRARSRFDF